MAETTPLTPRDYDPWHLATPQQLLTLLKRLGVSGSEVARWVRLPRSAVSMWVTGTRPVPHKYVPALRTYTQRAWDRAVELNTKAVALAPTEDLREALRAECAALWTRWKSEVLYDAGTLRRGLEADYATLGTLVGKAALTPEDVEAIAAVCDTLVQKARLVLELQPETPSLEAQLIARLTAAHAAARAPDAEKP